MTNAEATSVTDLLIASRTETHAGDTAARLAIVGMGLVGRRHLAALSHIGSANICAVVDTDDNILELAEQAGIAGYSDLSEMIINTRRMALSCRHQLIFMYHRGWIVSRQAFRS